MLNSLSASDEQGATSKGGGMEPVTLGVMAGTGLLSGLLAQAAQAAQEKKRREMEAMMYGANAQKEAAQQLQSGQQSAFQQLMATYRDALVR